MKTGILAIATTTPDLVAGGAPIFAARNDKELHEKAFLLEKILDAMVHQLDETTFIIVKH
jgi:hypothetical protein